VRVRVLGSAAGGGFPQWNCGCGNCLGVRAGTVRAVPRTQDSLAVTSDGERWAMLNCSPEVRAQIEAFPSLHPRAPRHTPITAIVLTNGDLDHCLGLFSLRESQPLTIFATDAVRAGLTESIFYRTLERFPGQVTWKRLVLDEEVDLGNGLRVRARAVAGKPPLHLAGRAPSAEDNVGLWIGDQRHRIAYVPGAADVAALSEPVDCLFFDGTFHSENELIELGLGTRPARDMAHIPVGASLAALAGVAARRRIFTHINNTNPILLDDSPERAALTSAGWEVAFDGMELSL
jgi:pyrroloquinoline quinone biosynthesis protein B